MSSQVWKLHSTGESACCDLHFRFAFIDELGLHRLRICLVHEARSKLSIHYHIVSGWKYVYVFFAGLRL